MQKHTYVTVLEHLVFGNVEHSSYLQNGTEYPAPIDLNGRI